MRSSLLDGGMEGLSGRFLGSRKLRALLTAFGVALGVALIVSMTMLGSTLQASITEQLRQGFGTYDIMAGYHDRLMQSDEQARLARLHGVKYAVGILYLSPNRPETRGVDMRLNYIAVGEFPKGEYGYPVKEGKQPGPGEFAAEQRMVDALGLKLGDSTTLNFRSGAQKVTLVGILPPQKASSDSIMLSLPWLQEQMNLKGQVTLQVFGLQRGITKDIVGEELRLTSPDLDIQLRKELDDVIRNMGGLKPMAIAFGIAGLFASIFLVAGSFNIAVQERARELALLRAVGAGQKQVMRLVLREAVLLGAVGSAAGVILGALAASGTASLAATSLGVQQRTVVITWLPLLVEWAVGAALAVVAAWAPARSAGSVPPLAAMRPDAQREAAEEKAGSRAGIYVMAAGTAMVAFSLLLKGGEGARALCGAGGGLMVVVGMLMGLRRILPSVVGALAVPLRPLLPAESVIASRSVVRHRKRSALTVATLILGIMLITSVTTVFNEMSRNGDAYTRSQFPGDAQVEASRGSSIGPGLPERLAQVPGVTGVAFQGVDLWGEIQNPEIMSQKLAQEDWVVGLAPIDLGKLRSIYDLGRIQGKLDQPGITITEEQARKSGLAIGEVLDLRFINVDANRKLGLVDKLMKFPVAAIVEHLPFGGAMVAVNPGSLPAVPDRIVFFKYDPAKRAQVKEAVLETLRQPGYGMAILRDLTEVLEQNRQAMNQRWAIVGAVAGVTFMISAFGLVNSVVTGLYQRRREMATVRAIGSTPAQTTRQVVLEALLLGLSGSVLGLVAGGLFTFGVVVGLAETLRQQAPYWLYAACMGIGPALAIAASLLPALRVSRGPVARVLQAD